MELFKLGKVPWEETQLTYHLFQVVNNFYQQGNFELPGIGADDWIKVFKI